MTLPPTPPRPSLRLRRAWSTMRARVMGRGAGGGAHRRDEDGFMLLEVVMSIALITVLMAALGSFFLKSVSITDEQRAREAATQIATTTMERLRSMPASDLVTGHDTASVTTQFAGAPTAVLAALQYMTPAVDPLSTSAGSGAAALVSTTPTTQLLNNVSYSVAVYLGRCATIGTTSAACVGGVTGVDYLRAVVAVTWRDRGCAAGSCSYVSATLISQAGDPTFNTSQNPPGAPVITDPGNQTSTVNVVESLQLTVNSGTGVAPLTWQVTTGSLPGGLTLSSSGLVSGTATAVAAATSITVTVTDAFARAASVTFTWRVVAAPTITTPAAQTSTVGQAVNLAVTATCANTPCTYALANAPAGLSINAATGVITGNPTTAGTYATVTVSVTDNDGARATTAAFTWRVNPAPTVATTGSLTASVGSTQSVAVTYTCPTTTCTLLLTGGVPGVGLSATTPRTTSNTANTISVPSGAGTFYLAGVVQASAVPSGTSAAYNPTVKITDGNGTAATSASGTWTIYSAPTVAAPGTRTMTVGVAKSIPLAYTCPDLTCTIALTNPVPGLGLSTTAGGTAANSTTLLSVTGATGTVYVTGTVATSAVSSGTSRAYAIVATINDGSVATAASGTWTAYVVPTIAYPGSQAAEPSQTLSLQTNAVCPNGGCTYVADARIASDTTYYPIAISTTGLITYGNAPAGSYVIRVRVTDADGVEALTTFPVTIETFTLAIPNQTTTRPASGTKTVTLNVASLVRPVADGYTYTLSGQPSWLTINAAGVLTATILPNSVSDPVITVTVTSSGSSSSFVSTSFAWNLS